MSYFPIHPVQYLQFIQILKMYHHQSKYTNYSPAKISMNPLNYDDPNRFHVTLFKLTTPCLAHICEREYGHIIL